jgi:hypothetical protein
VPPPPRRARALYTDTALNVCFPSGKVASVRTNWRCSECGCSRETATRRRTRRGLGPLRSWAHTCSPECKAARKRAYDHRLWEAAGRRRVTEPDHGPGWHCSECGADLEQANRKRARLGLGPMHSAWQKVCSPACATARRARRYSERWGGR